MCGADGKRGGLVTDLVHVSSKGTQDYTTPPELVQYFARSNGVELILDLAASTENARCPFFITKERDEANELPVDWAVELMTVANHADLVHAYSGAWLNPPFKRCAPFMERAAKAGEEGAKIITLTLASLGTDWYRKWVKPYALSLILEERVRFLGQPDDYPKELMVSFYGFGRTGLGWTKWKREAYATYSPTIAQADARKKNSDLVPPLSEEDGIPVPHPLIDIPSTIEAAKILARSIQKDQEMTQRMDAEFEAEHPAYPCRRCGSKGPEDEKWCATCDAVFMTPKTGPQFYDEDGNPESLSDSTNFAIGKGSWDGAFDNMPDGLED